MIKVTEELAQAILNYLGTKPFNEVRILIAELQKSEIIKEELKEV